MRRFFPRVLLTTMVVLPGCARERPEERKPLSARLVDFIGWELLGCKTPEEYDDHMAKQEQKNKDAQDEWERVRRQ